MRTRGEILASKTKPTAEERTLPLPNLTPVMNTIVKCAACDEDVDLSKLAKRPDGNLECSSCAAPIKENYTPSVLTRVNTEKVQENKVPEKKENTYSVTKDTVVTRTGMYCSVCGSEWPTRNDVPWINCGHMDAFAVNDPKLATNMKDITPSGKTDVNVIAPVTVSASKPMEDLEGSSQVSITWGKTIFPVGEAVGHKYSNMDVGPFRVYVTLPKEGDRGVIVDKALEELKSIADKAFEIQFKWYRDRIGLDK